MSLGYCGQCVLVRETEPTATYCYSGENWNAPHSQKGDYQLLDGTCTLKKACLEEPEVHVKPRRLPSGRKVEQVKRVTHLPSIHTHLAKGHISVTRPCKNEFSQGDTPHYLAYRLLVQIFLEYQHQRKLPPSATFLQ